MRSEMYADYLSPRGLHEGMRLAIWSGREGIEDISLLRPWSIGPYTDPERDLAQLLRPHLRCWAEISRRLTRAEISSLAQEAAFERSGQAVLLLDVTGGSFTRTRPRSPSFTQAADSGRRRSGWPQPLRPPTWPSNPRSRWPPALIGAPARLRSACPGPPGRSLR